MKINLHFTIAAFRMGDSIVGHYRISQEIYFKEFPPIGLEITFDIRPQISIPFVIQGPFHLKHSKRVYSAKIAALKSESLPRFEKEYGKDDHEANIDLVNDFFASGWRVMDLKTSEFLSKEIDE